MRADKKWGQRMFDWAVTGKVTPQEIGETQRSLAEGILGSLSALFLGLGGGSKGG